MIPNLSITINTRFDHLLPPAPLRRIVPKPKSPTFREGVQVPWWSTDCLLFFLQQFYCCHRFAQLDRDKCSPLWQLFTVRGSWVDFQVFLAISQRWNFPLQKWPFSLKHQLMSVGREPGLLSPSPHSDQADLLFSPPPHKCVPADVSW